MNTLVEPATATPVEPLPATVVEAFLRMVDLRRDTVALRRRTADGVDQWTWRDYANRVARVAGGLEGLGFGAGERVMLLMRNAPEFHVCDLAVVFQRGIPLSIYNSSSSEQIAWLGAHSEATVCFVDSDLLDRVLAVRDRLPRLRAIVVVDSPDSAQPAPRADGLISLGELSRSQPVDLTAAAGTVSPDDLVTIIYTSGTTGTPKGVLLSHANVAAEFAALMPHIGPTGFDERVVSYLPMAHIAERVVSHYLPMFWGNEVTSCPNMDQLSSYLSDVRPTFFFGPPRVFEKMYAGVHAVLTSSPPERRQAFEQALAVGHQVADYRARGEDLPPDVQRVWAEVDAGILGPVRQLLGIDQMRIMVSGAAPIPVEVLTFLRDLGAPMSELFGMSENTGAMIWDSLRVRPGWVGRALPGVQLRIAADGELLCRGPIVFRGYLNEPERTAETLDADGWLHTGDIATMDDDGYVRIVDRKKELIVTAGGKNVSPANLEAELKMLPLVGQAMVVGDGKPYLAALVVLDPEVAPAWARGSGIEAASMAELAAAPAVVEEVRQGIAAVNRTVSRAESVRRFVLLAEEWTPDSPELTPTMKLKRRGVLERYGPLLEELYRGGGITVEEPEEAAQTAGR